MAGSPAAAEGGGFAVPVAGEPELGVGVGVGVGVGGGWRWVGLEGGEAAPPKSPTTGGCDGWLWQERWPGAVVAALPPAPPAPGGRGAPAAGRRQPRVRPNRCGRAHPPPRPVPTPRRVGTRPEGSAPRTAQHRPRCDGGGGAVRGAAGAECGASGGRSLGAATHPRGRWRVERAAAPRRALAVGPPAVGVVLRRASKAKTCDLLGGHSPLGSDLPPTSARLSARLGRREGGSSAAEHRRGKRQGEGEAESPPPGAGRRRARGGEAVGVEVIVIQSA